MKDILLFTDEQAQNISFSGGKGANLSKMTRGGFPVPQGFIVTAQAYTRFIEQADFLDKEIARFDYAHPQHLIKQTQALKKKLTALDLPNSLRKEIRQALRKFKNVKAFSVRSSSTMEDLSGAAFAGQHDTFLNCVGEKDIADKIKQCFLSLWHDRAVAYRHKQGFDQHTTMAVVVQQMVHADTAGVGFSINPVSGNVQEILINANYGLGESVVSGESTVDQFIVSKKDGKIVQRAVAQKEEKIILLARGTKTVRLSGKEALKPCLSDAQIKQVAHLNKQVEKHYGFPQDIEWAFQGRKLFLLQARPITTLPARWTRDESAERYPTVITPFTWDFVEKAFHISLNHSFRLMGLPPFEGKWFAMFDNYIYGNQNAVWLYMGQTPVQITSLDDLRGKIGFLKDRFAYVQELPVKWTRNLDIYLLGVGALMAEDLSKKDIRGVWEYILRVAELGTNYFRPNIAISITQALLYKMFLYFITLAVGEKEAKRLFPLLIATTETKTNLVNSELYGLAQLAKEDSALKGLLTKTPSKEIIRKQQLKKFPAFEKAFDNFLKMHGHRETDFDYYIPTWVEAPWVVLDNLKLIITTPQTKTPLEKEYEVKIANQEAQAQLFAKLPQDLHFFYYEMLRLVRAYTSLDDIEHYQTTRLTLPIRKGTLAMGQLLKKANIVKDPYDVFFCHMDSLRQFVEGKLSKEKLARVIATEKAAYQKNKARTPAWDLQAAQDTKKKADASTLCGLAGSPGVAEGNVFVVRSTQDFAKFPKNAVLVARTTNPAWTPLFYNACALITESGGPLSHGAVTAREMKLPAVMSVRDVLKTLRNGQKVRVNGSKGIVEILKK